MLLKFPIALSRLATRTSAFPIAHAANVTAGANLSLDAFVQENPDHAKAKV
jgi:hypothetical protein